MHVDYTLNRSFFSLLNGSIISLSVRKTATKPSKTVKFAVNNTFTKSILVLYSHNSKSNDEKNLKFSIYQLHI